MNLLKNKELIFDSLNLVNKCINANESDAGELAVDTLKLFGKVLQTSNEQTSKTMFYNDNNFFEKMKKSKYTKFINNIKALNIPIDEYSAVNWSSSAGCDSSVVSSKPVPMSSSCPCASSSVRSTAMPKEWMERWAGSAK